MCFEKKTLLRKCIDKIAIHAMNVEWNAFVLFCTVKRSINFFERKKNLFLSV